MSWICASILKGDFPMTSTDLISWNYHSVPLIAVYASYELQVDKYFNETQILLVKLEDLSIGF